MEANHVIFFEPCINPTLMVQAIGRVHRLGQRREVVVHHLLSTNTVEARIAELTDRRRVRTGGQGEEGEHEEELEEEQAAARRAATALSHNSYSAADYQYLLGLTQVAP